MSTIIITTAQTVRQLVLQQVQAIPEELYDIKPDAFNNTIRWNIGHIIFWMDSYMSQCFHNSSDIPETYTALFNSGTKPAEWTTAPPSKEELIGELSRQLSAFSEISPDRLNKPLDTPLHMGPLTFNLAGELFNFAIVHETMHFTTCGSLFKVIQESR
ncbi:DinB family protein [Paenibacillus nasutitermitis]|uniref:Formate dehydrogenase n=1 Tax=Paenibacillus nasutitermitis TaxID=1652958 RepID=A0A916YTI1_9BACL|nr:DinB family protein [Paenibacillus nasutitermitis]GGD59587.1 formate dehydrogenase [Paenibacillus nasutitermitis]